MQLVNLTSNTVTVFNEDGSEVLFELPTDPPAIGAEFIPEFSEPVEDGESGNIVPVARHRFRLYSELPEPEEGVVYIVGYAVLQAVGEERPDCVAPDTGRDSAVRGVNGRLLGVRRFRSL